MGGIEKSQALLELKASGDAMLKIGRKLGIGTSVVQRVFKQEPRSSLIERTEGRKRTIIAKRTVLEKCHSENPPR